MDGNSALIIKLIIMLVGVILIFICFALVLDNLDKIEKKIDKLPQEKPIEDYVEAVKPEKKSTAQDRIQKLRERKEELELKVEINKLQNTINKRRKK